MAPVAPSQLQKHLHRQASAKLSECAVYNACVARLSQVVPISRISWEEGSSRSLDCRLQHRLAVHETRTRLRVTDLEWDPTLLEGKHVDAPSCCYFPELFISADNDAHVGIEEAAEVGEGVAAHDSSALLVFGAQSSRYLQLVIRAQHAPAHQERRVHRAYSDAQQCSFAATLH